MMAWKWLCGVMSWCYQSLFVYFMVPEQVHDCRVMRIWRLCLYWGSGTTLCSCTEHAWQSFSSVFPAPHCVQSSERKSAVLILKRKLGVRPCTNLLILFRQPHTLDRICLTQTTKSCNVPWQQVLFSRFIWILLMWTAQGPTTERSIIQTSIIECEELKMDSAAGTHSTKHSSDKLCLLQYIDAGLLISCEVEQLPSTCQTVVKYSNLWRQSAPNASIKYSLWSLLVRANTQNCGHGRAVVIQSTSKMLNWSSRCHAWNTTVNSPIMKFYPGKLLCEWGGNHMQPLHTYLSRTMCVLSKPLMNMSA